MTSVLSCALTVNMHRPLDLSLTQAKPITANVFQTGAPSPNWRDLQSVRSEFARSWVRKSIADDLRRIDELQDGWLGAGSLGVSKDVVANVEKTAEAIANTRGLSAPEVTPTTHGTVSLEWENSSMHVYIEIGKTRSNGFLNLQGSEPILFSNCNDFSNPFFSVISELLNPSKGLSVSLPEGSTVDTFPLVS